MKQIILIRKDLKLKQGKACSQVAHAAVGATLLAFTRFKGLFSEWEAQGQKKVVLKATSEKELLHIYQQAKDRGLPCYLVHDAGLTTFHGQPTLTAAAIGPADDYVVDPLVEHLKLL